MNVIDLGGRTPAQRQGLLSQLVVPRPIAMITTLDGDGSLDVAIGRGDHSSCFPWFVTADDRSIFRQERLSYAEHPRTSAPAQAG